MGIEQRLGWHYNRKVVFSMRKNRILDFYDEADIEIENEILTPEEVMAYLYIGRNSFYRLVNSGELPAFRIGKLWRISREDLLQFLRQK